jgi:hypothetical protein
MAEPDRGAVICQLEVTPPASESRARAAKGRTSHWRSVKIRPARDDPPQIDGRPRRRFGAGPSGPPRAGLCCSLADALLN